MKNRFKIILVLVLIISEAILLTLWYYGIWTDFVINLLTEILGIAITVILIDHLLEKNNKIVKKETNDLAFRLSLNICKQVISLFYPNMNLANTRIVKYKFGEHEIYNYSDLVNKESFTLSLENKELFKERIKSEILDPSFNDRSSIQKYIQEKNEKLISLIFMIEASLNAFHYFDENELYSTLLEMRIKIFEYQELKTTVGGPSSIGNIMSDYEIDLLNTSLKLNQLVEKNADKIEVMDFEL